MHGIHLILGQEIRPQVIRTALIKIECTSTV